ncbi:nucleoid-associated protein [Anaerovorax odorimutans]|uniref:nucleoid-associated protein n=1 Tax=Anaerovorax odorimutans TaxID=109327 RepID=UPI0004029260|nr:nucleoid-associated protein [Anaerovorax odorimutans]
MREIIIEKAILHILDTTVDTTVLSEELLNLSETEEFLQKHIIKLLKDSEIKECIFEKEGNQIRENIRSLNDDNFIFQSQQIANTLHSFMLSNIDIPAADVVFCIFKEEQNRYIGILKFNYKEAYTHSLNIEDDKQTVSLMKYKTILANDTQKIDECIFINLNDFSLKIKEKKYEINGQKDYYISNYLLKAQPAHSYKEQYKIVEKSAEEIVKKYYPGDSMKQAEVKIAIKNNVDENLEVDIDNIAREAFSDSEDMQNQYKSEISQNGFVEKKIKINEQIYEKLEKSHKIITDVGIKMDIPTDLLKDKRKVEFIVNQDGTMSILIKNINEMKNR